jgi:hypothetical protein
MIKQGLQPINLVEIPRGCLGSCCCSSGVDPGGFYPFCSGFRMRVSAAPFAGHASGGPPAAAHVRDAELRGGHLGHAAKADDLQLNRKGRTPFPDFICSAS